jgi:hypothetical protein
MAKSRNKRKNGKVKKYQPKPKGISKKKLEKLLEQFKNQTINNSSEEGVVEIRTDESQLEILDDSKKKYNVVSSDSTFIEGPELSQNQEEKTSDES